MVDTNKATPRARASRTRIVDDPLIAGLGDQFEQNNAHAGEGSERIIRIDAIDLDEHNARTEGRLPKQLILDHVSGKTDLAVSLTAKVEQTFFEDLLALAQSLASPSGQLDPILVYEQSRAAPGEPIRYRNIGGERRILASLLNGRTTIRATVRPQPQDPIAERAMALVHNTHHRELSLKERIFGMRHLANLFVARHQRMPTTGELGDLIHEPKRTCQRYLRYINVPDAILGAVNDGRLNSVRRLDFVLGGEDEGQQIARIEQIVNEQPSAATPAGASTPNAQYGSTQERSSVKASTPAKRKGAKTRWVHLGKTSDLRAVKRVITSSIKKAEFKLVYSEVNWDDAASVQQAWDRFLVDQSGGVL